MKNIILAIIVLTNICLSAQVKIGNNLTTIGNGSILELEGTNTALVITRVANTAAVIDPVIGMIVYDMSSNCFKGFQNGSWTTCGFLSASSNGTAIVSSYSCSTAVEGFLILGYDSDKTRISITVTVTTPGTYSLSASANGVSFVGSGTFPVAGTQTIHLYAYGTPIAYGSHTYVLNTTPSCSFNVFTYQSLPGNRACDGAPISATGCATVSGATLNDDPASTLGVEYDWASATNTTMGIGFGASTNTRSIVDIGGQCWAKFNMNIDNNLAPAVDDGVDRGSSDYYTGGPFGDEGYLYQWSSAMNLQTDEKAQGICPNNWHVPSDCEWMYLENTLGMSTPDQENDSVFRDSGDVGADLSTFTLGGTNISGFTALMAGYGNKSPTFSSNGSETVFWTSSPSRLGGSQVSGVRALRDINSGVLRAYVDNSFSFSVRCIKD